MIPPPEALLAKSAYVPEEAVTGGDVSFLKLQRLIGLERVERLNAYNKERMACPDRPGDIPMNTNMVDYIMNCN